MTPVTVVAFAYLSLMGLFAMAVLAVRRMRRFEHVSAPLLFSVAVNMEMQAMVAESWFHWLYLSITWATLIACLLTIPRVISRRIPPLEAGWFAGAFLGAVCALTFQRIPVAASDGLAVAAAVTGTVCFMAWFKQLPPRSSAIS
ncbi:MAG TPA: hypothetical protein VFN49_13560 [Candidatus Aquilonibacter sp.]|nr:hypothetical protein [Candidatus Aquilonibacter sp.]